MQYPSPNRTERLADGLVHLAGTVFALLAGAYLLSRITGSASGMDTGSERGGFAFACGIYVLALIGSKFLSAGYHLSPHDGVRPLLRRLDHSAIYVLIAATFSPFLIHAGTPFSHGLLVAIWACAAVGLTFKLFLNGVDARWSLFSYIAMGWLGLLMLPSIWGIVPAQSLLGMIAGAVIYTSGTAFYARKSLPYRYAIWHCFVLGGSAAFLFAVVNLTPPM